MLFNELGLSAELLRAVDSTGYREATPIQQQAIPIILDGRDVLASAQTGTGKTAGFMLPLLHRLQQARAAGDGKSRDRHGRRPRVLILTPTRELAAQVSESAKTYGKFLPFSATTIYGGVSIRPQIQALRNGVDIVVATPGRLLDHVGQRTIDLRGIEILVLDEADRMLDMGFIRDIRKIIDLLPQERQNLLFSATFSKEIRQLAAKLLNSPKEIATATRNTTAERVRQTVYPVDRNRKRELLSHRIGGEDWRQVLVFTRTKHGADRLAEQLERDGLRATAIHGRKSQNARTRALADFKSGKLRVLVATDVASRGLDIDKLPHVVNYELPFVAEDYVHRIGRTARAGQEGHAISLVCVDEHRLLADIERLIGHRIEKEIVAGYEVDPSIRPEPITQGRGNQQNRSRQAPRRPRPGGAPKSQKSAGARGQDGGRSGNARAGQARSGGPRGGATRGGGNSRRQATNG
jgi:ATP-dependent RNA helicase RhlE